MVQAHTAGGVDRPTLAGRHEPRAVGPERRQETTDSTVPARLPSEVPKTGTPGNVYAGEILAGGMKRGNPSLVLSFLPHAVSPVVVVGEDPASMTLDQVVAPVDEN